MKNLTTPKAILIGLGLIALAIAIKPITGGLIGTANADQEGKVVKVQICGTYNCAEVSYNGLLQVQNH